MASNGWLNRLETIITYNLKPCIIVFLFIKVLSCTAEKYFVFKEKIVLMEKYACDDWDCTSA